MLLCLDQACAPMKMVYLLSEDLKENPERIALTQVLTLNKLKPQMGLKGSQGLFDSPEWWDNIMQGKMPLLHISGVIHGAYIAGQEESRLNNTIDLVLSDGSVRSVGI